MSADGKDIDVDDTGELLMILDYLLVAMIGYERGNKGELNSQHIDCKKRKNEAKIRIPIPRTSYDTPIER